MQIGDKEKKGVSGMVSLRPGTPGIANDQDIKGIRRIKMDYTHEYQYESLAGSIVVEACKDYRKASKRLKKNPDDYKAFLCKRDCEKFFRSRYFGIICDLDPEILMNRITEAYV